MREKTCVVFDTNIWFNTNFLKTAMGASALFYANQADMVLGLPEVLEQELQKYAVKKGQEAVENIRKNYEIIEALMGERDDYQVPTSEELVSNAERLIDSLGNKVVRTPLTLQQVKRALRKVMEEVPPNDKDQQFKDSCIWEAIVDLANEYKVHFVTKDKAFYENREPKHGLAKNLQKQLDEHELEVKIHESLNIFLNEVKQETPKIDRDHLVRHLFEYMSNELKLEEASIQDLKSCELSAFLTEKQNILSLSFNIDLTVEFTENESEDEYTGSIRVEGECYFDIVKDNISNVVLNTITNYKLDGTRKNAIIYASAATIGRGTKKHMLKIPFNPF